MFDIPHRRRAEKAPRPRRGIGADDFAVPNGTQAAVMVLPKMGPAHGGSEIHLGGVMTDRISGSKNNPYGVQSTPEKPPADGRSLQAGHTHGVILTSTLSTSRGSRRRSELEKVHKIVTDLTTDTDPARIAGKLKIFVRTSILRTSASNSILSYENLRLKRGRDRREIGLDAGSVEEHRWRRRGTRPVDQ